MFPQSSRRQQKGRAAGSSRHTRSHLACNSCRRKKTRWLACICPFRLKFPADVIVNSDRALPSCLSCTKLQQHCTYPAKRLKPGPKLDPCNAAGRNRYIEANVRRQGSTADCVDNNDNVSAASTVDAERLVRDGPSSYKSSSNIETNFAKAVNLSSLIHPGHEAYSHPSSLGGDVPASASLLSLIGTEFLLVEACEALDMTIYDFQRLTDLYFENMTVFSLFHQPSFGQKIQNIRESVNLQALFASMFSFAVRFDTLSSTQNATGMEKHADSSRFLRKALALIEQSLKETADQPPSLCLLQAMTIATYCQLTNGVRGQAWRLVGSCVRLAYEANLHLIDYEAHVENFKIGRDLARWTAEEERRRCWWAIWELDSFASTIRRCPTAIDWSMIDTYLPVQDKFWFNNHYQPSCFLEPEPVNRYKMLLKHGNENPNAWLIVINSIMRNAQVLLKGNLQGILVSLNPHDHPEQLIHYFRNSFCRRKTAEESAKLRTLIRSLDDLMERMPVSLKFQGESLDFGVNNQGDTVDIERKRLHSTKFTVYLAVQLARFMIYHHYAFEETTSGSIFADNCDGLSSSSQNPEESAHGLQTCLRVADDIYALVSKSSRYHFKYVSSFLGSTIWLAASLQVLRKTFAIDERNDEIASKYNLLRTTCEQFTEFWQIPLVLLENLDSLESRLRRFRESPPARAGVQETYRAPETQFQQQRSLAKSGQQLNSTNERPFSSLGYNEFVQLTHSRSNTPKSSEPDDGCSGSQFLSFSNQCPTRNANTAISWDDTVLNLFAFEYQYHDFSIPDDREVINDEGGEQEINNSIA
ncbi:hypothetical protein BS50DRAFT_558840 [Corynespora cassiicola Philippines]|uniref:Xylanolytic transcriptional activator regulatory domain-containing protein n=1 Tax=Corynespora cassiicola Philippines TaxID=1448308 RepID=A0A2T2NC91_CORCC|nr:hypothetical protein BS50DRAFT_558840 [Corynespora cassiicola Philippines]